MATFIASTGDDFIVQKEDRGYQGKLTEALKVNGTTGVVTVAGQTISSSGVVGSVGAVTATTIAASSTLAVTGAATLSGGVAVTGAATVGGKTVATGSLYSAVHAGVAAPGAVTLAGTQIGDQLVAAVDLTDSSDVQTGFEATVTVAGQIQQSTATDLHLKTILFILHRP